MKKQLKGKRFIMGGRGSWPGRFSSSCDLLSRMNCPSLPSPRTWNKCSLKCPTLHFHFASMHSSFYYMPSQKESTVRESTVRVGWWLPDHRIDFLQKNKRNSLGSVPVKMQGCDIITGRFKLAGWFPPLLPRTQFFSFIRKLSVKFC